MQQANMSLIQFRADALSIDTFQDAKVARAIIPIAISGLPEVILDHQNGSIGQTR